MVTRWGCNSQCSCSSLGPARTTCLLQAAEKAFSKLPSGGKTANELVKEVRLGWGAGWPGGCRLGLLAELLSGWNAGMPVHGSSASA